MTEHFTSYMEGQSSLDGDTRRPFRIQSDAVNPLLEVV